VTIRFAKILWQQAQNSRGIAVDIKSIIGSSIRSEALFALRHGPQTAAELAKRLGKDQPNVLKFIKPLVLDGTITRKEGAHRDATYCLSSMGLIRSAQVSQIYACERTLGRLSEFISKHDLSWMPAQFLARMGDLADADIVMDQSDELFKSQQNFVKLRRRTPLQAGGACEAPPHKDGAMSF
jgi:predicted transcriptional regulator